MVAGWPVISTSSFGNLKARMSEPVDLVREVIVISSDEEEVNVMAIRSRGTKRGLDRNLVEEDMERTARAKRFRIGTALSSDEEELIPMGIRSRRTQQELGRGLVEEDAESTARAESLRIRTELSFPSSNRQANEEEGIKERAFVEDSDSGTESAIDRGLEGKPASSVWDWEGGTDCASVSEWEGDKETPNVVSNDKECKGEFDSKLVASAWRRCLVRLERKKPRIFSSTEARLQVDSRARRGNSVYDGIGATEANCMGLRKVLHRYCELNGVVGDSRKTKAVKLLRTTVSQFLRWAVVRSSCSKYDVWKEEALFKSIARVELVEPFISYFERRCDERTAKEKAADLLNICDSAYSAARGKRMREGLSKVSMLLQCVAGKRGRRLSTPLLGRLRSSADDLESWTGEEQ